MLHSTKAAYLSARLAQLVSLSILQIANESNYTILDILLSSHKCCTTLFGRIELSLLIRKSKIVTGLDFNKVSKILRDKNMS